MGVALGPFWLARRIAAGRTGEVWQGVHRRDSVQVAVKILTLGKRSRAAREVFRREVGILAGLDHPNIVRIWDQGEVPAPVPEGLQVEAGSPYLVMEQGRATLGDRKDPMPWSRVRRVAVDLLTALAHAHGHRVLHRDIKPANILLCPADRPGEKDRVVLTDFGFAAPAGEETELVGLTPGFAAPEQLAFDARSEGPWTDLFALGCVLWRLLTGKSPFDTASVEVAIQMQARPLPRLENVPPPVVAWLRSLLAIAPTDRPPSAVHALKALLMAEGGGVLELGRDWRAERAIHPGPRNLTGAGLGLVGLRSGSVGREDVRDALWGAFRTASTGRTTAVGLRGVEGIGKSHLAKWLAEEAHERWGAEEWTVEGPSLAEGLVVALRRRIGIEGDPRGARARVGTWLDATGGQGLFEAWSTSRALEPVADGGPDRWAAVADLLRRACRRVPLVVRVEDAQGMSDLTTFLPWLLSQRTDLAITFVITRRAPGWPPAVPPLPAPAVEFALEPLASVVTEALLGENLGLAPELQGQLALRCAGNPGLAQRLLLRCIDAGELAPDEEGRWGRAGEALALSDEDLVEADAAVAALFTASPADRDWIEAAAALGDRVESATLFAVERAGGPPIDRGALQRLVAAGWWAPTAKGWAFVDGRVAEAVRRRSRATDRWARWNEAAAQVFARVPGGDAQIRRGVHLLEAGRVGDAVGPWRRGLEARLDEQPASVSCASIGAWASALDRLRLPAQDERQGAPAELLVALAWQAGDLGRARRLAAALASRAEGRWPDVRAQACRYLAMTRLDTLDVEGARGWAAAAVSAARRPEVVAVAALAAAEVDLLAGDVEGASRRLEEGLVAASGFGAVECRLLFAVCRIAVSVDQRPEARALVQRAAAIVERTGREADAWTVRELLGRLAASRGELAVAASHFDAAAAGWRSAGQVEAERAAVAASLPTRLDARTGVAPAVRLLAASPLARVRAVGLAASAADAAAGGDVAGVDRATAELAALLNARRLFLPDVAAVVARAVRSLSGDEERARRLTALAWTP